MGNDTATKPLCKFVGCKNKQQAKGLCSGHYKQASAGKELSPLQVRARRQVKNRETRECLVEGCTDKAGYKGYCPHHTRQIRNGKQPKPKRVPVRATSRNASGEKQCGSCKSWFPESGFSRGSVNRDGLMSRCKTCCVNNGRYNKYGLTPDGYKALLDKQGGKCAGCGVDAHSVPMNVDHDHSCCSTAKTCGRCVRGLLCSPCNKALGLVRDSPNVLDALSQYLRRNS